MRGTTTFAMTATGAERLAWAARWGFEHLRSISARTGFRDCSGRQLAFLGLVVALLVVGHTDHAFAQTAGFQPLNTFAKSVLDFMTGTFATSVATIAVAIVGFTAFTGRIPWGMAISIVVGIVLIFGAAQIVQSLSAGAGSGS